jgi:hypothetical protein
MYYQHVKAKLQINIKFLMQFSEKVEAKKISLYEKLESSILRAFSFLNSKG